MLFIFGIGPKTKVIKSAEFVCPVCRAHSRYELKQQRNYFSLFFIPLIPLSKTQGQFVICQNCGTKMPDHVLQHNQAPIPPFSN